MSLILQAFYWESPLKEKRNGEWWNYLTGMMDRISALGFRKIWLPPLSKSCEGAMGMGYDAYDYYDLGEYDQKNTVKTMFGSRAELEAMIKKAHALEISVLSEFLISHSRGGELEDNPVAGGRTATLFKTASGRWQRSYDDFLPSTYDSSPNRSPWKDIGAYDYCVTNPRFFREIMDYAQWLVKEIGIDGFRYDNCKAYPAFFPKAVQTYLDTYGLGEVWDNQNVMERWLEDMDFKADILDFTLRGKLADMCNYDDFNLTTLWNTGISFRYPENSVSFLENHDTERDAPVRKDILLGYAFLLTFSNTPVVFWPHLFNSGLLKESLPDGLERLIQVYKRHAGGQAVLLENDPQTLVFERQGDVEKSGLITMINLSPVEWRGQWVKTRWENTRFVPIAWAGLDNARPLEKLSSVDGWMDLYAPPRGYAVYIPVRNGQVF